MSIFSCLPRCIYCTKKNMYIYEPKVNLQIKVSFGNKYSFPGGLITPAVKSLLLFSIPTFFANVPCLIYQEKGILNNYETIAAQSPSMINKQKDRHICFIMMVSRTKSLLTILYAIFILVKHG